MVKALEEVLKEIYGEAKIEVQNSLSVRVETTDFTAHLTKVSPSDTFRVYLVEVRDPHTVSEQDFEILKMVAYFLEFVNLEGGDK